MAQARQHPAVTRAQSCRAGARCATGPHADVQEDPDRQPRRDRVPRHPHRPPHGHQRRSPSTRRPTATRCHVSIADEAVAIGPAPSRESYLVDASASSRACKRHRRRGGPPRLRLPVRERGVLRAARGERHRLHRPEGTRRSRRWATRSRRRRLAQQARSARFPATPSVIDSAERSRCDRRRASAIR